MSQKTEETNHFNINTQFYHQDHIGRISKFY